MKKYILASLICTLAYFFCAAQMLPHTCSERRVQQGKPATKILPTPLQQAYDVKWYFLNLQAENYTVALSGDVTIKAQTVWALMDTFSFHLHSGYTIDSIKVDGIEKTWIDKGDERLISNLAFEQDRLFDVQVFYHGSMSSTGAFFSGISTENDYRFNTSVTWTLSEPNNAYQWFPVKQDLTDKADSVWIFTTTSNTNKVGSNGKLTATVSLPDNRIRYEWKSKYPIAYYLISIAVANYQDYSIYAQIPQTQDSILIQNFIYNTPNCLAYFKEEIDKTKDMVEFFSEIYGTYPFRLEKYGHSLAPLNGGMEHQTMTTLNTFADWLVAHELAHQWFGDNVTCASWEYIWLNEGFASYSQALWNEHIYGRDIAFNIFFNGQMQDAMSQPGGSVYVPVGDIDNEERIFSSQLTYSKGASIIHMLRFELGNDSLFFSILQTYQQRFSNKNAVLDDFKRIAEELSGKDFTVFFDQWFYGEGYPLFDITWRQSGNDVFIESEQTTSSPITPLFGTPFEVKIFYNDGFSETKTYYQQSAKLSIAISVQDERQVDSVIFDPNHWLLAKNHVAKIPNTNIVEISSEKRFLIYPNPAKNFINIQFDKKNTGDNKYIKVMNVEGKTVLHKQTSADNCQLDISTLPNGVYFVQISDNTRLSVQKLLK